MADLNYKYKNSYFINETISDNSYVSISSMEYFKSMKFFKIVGRSFSVAENHRENAESYIDILSGLSVENIEIVYIVYSKGQELEVLWGISEGYVNNVKNALSAAFPYISIEDVRDDKIKQKISVMNNGGVLTGYPSDKCNQSEFISYESPIDKVIRGMFGQKWCLIVNAKSIGSGYIYDIISEIKSEATITLPQVQKSISGQGALKNEQIEEKDYDAQTYYDNLNFMLDKMTRASREGAWRTCVCFMTENSQGLQQLSSLLKGVYGGNNSVPYSLKCIKTNNVVAYFKNGYGLAANTFNRNEYSFLADDMEPYSFFTRMLQNVMGTKELSVMTQLPEKEIPGYYLNKEMRFDCAQRRDDGDFEIGHVVYNGMELDDVSYAIDIENFTKHGLINGITGGGKSNTSKYILRQLYMEHSIPFLVIESAKQEYYEMARIIRSPNPVLVFTLGYEGINSVKFRLNPFERIGDVPLQLHIDYVLSSFKASFELYPPMPYILETSIYRIYSDLGWDILNDKNIYGRSDYPTLEDLFYEVEIVGNELASGASWKGDVIPSLQARIQSLMVGGKGAMLNTKVSYPIDKLLNLPTVLELDAIGDDDVKSFVISAILVQIYEYRKSQMGNSTKKHFQHMLLIEEAHRLLKNVSTAQGGETANPQGKAVEFFCNMLAEIRSYGQGILISDQMPTKLAPDVLKNTNLKICHRIVTKEDREILGSAMNMNEEQIDNISMFKTGFAAVYSEGDSQAQLVKLPLVKNVNNKSRQEILDESRASVINNMPVVRVKKGNGAACSLCSNCIYKLKIEDMMDNDIDPVFLTKFVDAINKHNMISADFLDVAFEEIEANFIMRKLNLHEKICLVNCIEDRFNVSKAEIRKALVDVMAKEA